MKYLAAYIFRIALSNNRIEGVANETVSFHYTEGKTGAHKRATLPVDVFIGRFLAHVLPRVQREAITGLDALFAERKPAEAAARPANGEESGQAEAKLTDGEETSQVGT